MKTFAKMIVAVIVDMIFMVGLIMLGASDNAVISVFLFGGVGLCLVLGVFDVPAKRVNKQSDTIGGVLKDAA